MGWLIGLAIGAVGAGAYALDVWLDQKQAENSQTIDEGNLKAQAAHQIENLNNDKVDLEKTYTDSVARENEKFEIAKAEANEQANRTDLQATKQEGYLSADYNSYLQQMGIGMQQINQAINAGMMQNDQSAGSNIANVATAGVRGNSSVMGAVGRQAAYADKQLAQNITAQKTANNYDMQNAIRNMSQNVDAIADSRYNANYMRKSYLEGGSQYRLQQNNLSALEASYNQQLTNINKQIAELSGEDTSSYYDAITGKNVTLTNTNYKLSMDELKDNYAKQQYGMGWRYSTAAVKGGVAGYGLYRNLFGV